MRPLHKTGLALFLITILVIQVFLLLEQTLLFWVVLSLGPFVLVSMIYKLPLPTTVKPLLNFYRITLLLAGPFATVGLILMTLFSSRRHLAESYREFIAEETVFSPSEKMELDLIPKYEKTEQEDIAPYIVVMESQNSAMKRNTINKVVQHPSPTSRIILDKGLQDKDPDIRFYAASALIILNDEFVKEFREIQQSIEITPEDPQLYLELALSYERYCSWDLPEMEDRINYLNKMQQAYKKVLLFDPGNIQAIVGLANIYIDKTNYIKAANLVQRGMQRTADSPELAFLRLKLLYEQKKFSELRSSIKRFKENFSSAALEFQELISFWDADPNIERPA